jgi:hypothetical protein
LYIHPPPWEPFVHPERLRRYYWLLLAESHLTRRLTDYEVRVPEPKKGTAARVRVLIEWSDHRLIADGW